MRKFDFRLSRGGAELVGAEFYSAHVRRSRLHGVLAVAAGLLMVGATADLSAQASQKTYALTNARIETVTKGVIERGTVVVRDGRIAAVGAGVTAPAGAEVIDCGGLTIYPGFIDAGTRLGLSEIGSIPETQDVDELGDVTPHAQALTAVNPNSVSIPVTRTNGVTTALTMPDGGVLPGTAAVINLFGYTPRQMSVADSRVLVVSFPSRARGGWWDERSDEEIEKQWKEQTGILNEAWDRAQLYARIDSARRGDSKGQLTPEYVPEIEAMAPAVRGEMPVFIEVNRADDIDSAIAWAKKRNVRAVLTGVSEGWRAADRIAASGYPCIVGPVISIPNRDYDRYDKAYANPGLLRKAGVEIAIRTMDAENVRNLPYNAGFAAAYGLGREEALRAVTIVPARLLGIDSVLGSIETGKQATFFVADGDPFEPKTQVRHLFINGWNVPMENRHIDLYEEFLERKP